jgi:predicted TIM-barrel fold metal-dependent hydrolase
MLIDAHVHCVPSSVKQDFLQRGIHAIFREFSPDQMEEPLDSLLTDMGRAGVDCSIVVLAGDLSVLSKYADRNPNRLFAACIFDSREPRDGLRKLKREVGKYPHLVKAVKTIFPYLGQHPMQKEFFPLYRYCSDRKLPVQFHMGGDARMEEASDLLYFSRLASQFPNLKIVCLHAGGGSVGRMPLLAGMWSNVFVELEGLQLHEAEGSREPGVMRYLLEKIGSERLMFGSDRIFPEDKYFDRANVVKSLDSRHAENMCWKTANKVYRLGFSARTII